MQPKLPIARVTTSAAVPTRVLVPRFAALGAAFLLLVTSGCSSDETAATAAPSPTPTVSVTLQDPWIKTADSGMTAVFGTLRNTGTTPVSLVSATTTVSPRTELHETVMTGGAMQMQPKAGGFEIEPGGDHELKPGGDHIMVMDLAKPVAAGDEVTVTLTLSDGTTSRVTALGKATSAGEETYEPGAGMDMSPTPSGQ